MSLLTWTHAARRFARDTRGNIAMMFALSLPVLILMTVGGVDIHRASTVRVNLQDALDAATLAAARSSYTEDVDINRVGMASLEANLKAYPQITLRTGDTRFTLDENDVVIADAKVDVKTLVAHIFLPPYGQFMDEYIPVGAHSEVNRSSKNVEVALVLDTTGSMQGQKIIDLRAAASDLVDIVVQDQQSPYYSKVSVVPYSMAVNVDSYATNARGSIIGSANITGASWSTGSSKSISNITRSNPARITSNNHGFQNGDVVWINGVSGMTQVNNRAYVVSNRATNTFTLSGVSSSNWNNYSSGGTIRKCQVDDCSVVVTANSHGLSNNQYVRITNVSGMTQINDRTYRVSDVTTNTYSIGVNGANWDNYSSGGRSWCAQAGCTYYAFFNPYGTLVTQQISTCVTERHGTNAYTDASPGSARLGRNYPSSSNPCLPNTILPLSSNRTTIKSRINGLTASGSTAGHIGVGWGWYTVSPNFASLWPSNAAGPYNPLEVLKAVVIMTDGEYNSGYCNGVIAQDSTNGSGSREVQINCNAPNGHPFDQTLALCASMKGSGVIVYTVGFQVVDDPRARAIVNECATSANHVYMPNSGTDLSAAFQAIGRDITRLRISK